MANVDVNLLASLGFVMKNEGGGDRITLSLKPRITPSTDYPSVPNTQIGWSDIDFSFVNSYLGALLVQTDGATNLPVPLSVNPSVVDVPKFPDSTLAGETLTPYLGVCRFMQWVAENPVHITELNIRASSVQSIPTQIIVLTPDISSGQMTRQIIDVASRKNAYQYQNDIITITDLDFYLGRNSSIRFEGVFSHTLPANVSGLEGTDIPCYIDLKVDRYISLEKALVENVKLLNTAAGQANAIVQEVAKAEAKSAPTTLTLNTTDVNPNFNANLVANTVYPSIPQFQSKRRR